MDRAFGSSRAESPMRREPMNMNRMVQGTYFLLRVVAGLLFLQAGGLIPFGWFGGMPGQPGSTAPPLMSQIRIGGGAGVVFGALLTPRRATPAGGVLPVRRRGRPA